MTTAAARVPLYRRLPEIYLIRDQEQAPPDQLREYLAAVEEAFGAIHESIEALHADLFIETCDDWVIAYLADLVGTSHLKGDPHTLRADVADTIALRRRKGTLAALERLASNLTGWACRCVELRENLAWSQHLNHQRPDAGGLPPYGSSAVTRFTVRRGGTVPIRDPAMLALLGTPFDPFAYTADVKSADDGAVHVNLPNVAVLLWRLASYRIRVGLPLAKGVVDLGDPPARTDRARFAVRFDLDPLDRPVRLFNLLRAAPAPSDADASAVEQVGRLTRPDAVPGPMLAARLTSNSDGGHPAEYVVVDTFDATANPPSGFDLSEVGLNLFLPRTPFTGSDWKFRGDNLCAWEEGLRRPLRAGEIVIDPDIGRFAVGVATAEQRDALLIPEGPGFRPGIFAGYTYGAVGPVGAHPISRLPGAADSGPVELRPVSALPGSTSLQAALAGLAAEGPPVVVEIGDSLVHALDITALPGVVVDGGGLVAVPLNRSVVIRAGDRQRPIVRLAAPLRFRPVRADDPSPANPTVRLEGIMLARGVTFAPADGPLIARAAVGRLEIIGCTLDPGGHRQRDSRFSRAPMATSLRLATPYGFARAEEERAFASKPDVIIQRSITGALDIDEGYRLSVTDSIVDAGRGVGDASGSAFAIGPASNAPAGYGPPLAVDGSTFFGRVRVRDIAGAGGIFVHRLEALDNQRGCLKLTYLSGDGDRVPPNHGCVSGPGARLAFTSEWFGEPGYGQLSRSTDRRVRERGPNDDAMGAFGFLLESHKWTNAQIRFREFMPVGVRPLVVPAT